MVSGVGLEPTLAFSSTVSRWPGVLPLDDPDANQSSRGNA